MLQENFKIAINLATKALSDAKIPYAIVGTTSLALHGMDADPRDLDITVRRKDLEAARELFLDHTTSEIAKIQSKSNKPAWGFIVDLHGVEADFVGEEDDGTYVSLMLDGHTNNLDFGEDIVTCLTLEAQAKAYQETKRAHKAERIHRFLSGKK